MYEICDVAAPTTRHERGDVDHRPTAALEQVRDPVFAAEVDALRVDVLHALPRFGIRLEDRAVVGRRDARVVVEDVDAAVTLGRCGVHRLDAGRVRDVDLVRERVARLAGGGLGRSAVDVGNADARALGGEHERRLASHAAAGARDHRNLALESPGHRYASVEMNTFLTSE